jgi:hypothetical protein
MSTGKSVEDPALSKAFGQVNNHGGKGYLFLFFCMHIPDEHSTGGRFIVAYHDDIRGPHAIGLTQVSLQGRSPRIHVCRYARHTEIIQNTGAEGGPVRSKRRDRDQCREGDNH